MTLEVWTAPFRYQGVNRCDITRKSAPPELLPFAPSWAILRPALEARRQAAKVGGAEGRSIMGAAWTDYVGAYIAEMRASYRRDRAAWDALLQRECVVLVCYCPDPDHCHRRLLARVILPKLGVLHMGEMSLAVALGGMGGTPPSRPTSGDG